jgi:transcriptional regulator
MHLVRSNPIARAVTGPTRPSSPSPGPMATSRPTGTTRPTRSPPGTTSPFTCAAISQRRRPRHLRAISTPSPPLFEDRLPKTPWTTDKMTPDTMDRMMRQILPFRFTVAEVHGTWKLNQNKPEAARLGAARPSRPPPSGRRSPIWRS